MLMNHQIKIYANAKICWICLSCTGNAVHFQRIVYIFLKVLCACKEILYAYRKKTAMVIEQLHCEE